MLGCKLRWQVAHTEVDKKNSAMDHNFTDAITQLFAMMLFFNYHDFNYVIVAGENPLDKNPLKALCVFPASGETVRVFFITVNYGIIGDQIFFVCLFFLSPVLLTGHHVTLLVNRCFFIIGCSFSGYFFVPLALHPGFSGP